jgi:hypothetical protein
MEGVISGLKLAQLSWGDGIKLIVTGFDMYPVAIDDIALTLFGRFQYCLLSAVEQP